MAMDIKKMMDEYIKAWNSHDTNKIISFFTDDCIYEDVALGIVNHGIKETTAFVNTMAVDFPDFKLELKSVFRGS